MASYALDLENPVEWATACDVQRRFMRLVAPETGAIDCAARCRQVRELGGDCYHFLPLGGARFAVAIGDASGKGLSAALIIANVQSSLRTAAQLAPDDGPAVLAAVNRQVHESSGGERYATLFYGVYDETSGTLRYVNAGHNPPMVLRRSGRVEWLDAGGAPVGMFPLWPYSEGVARLGSGDLVIAYTDGLVEATDSGGTEWGAGGLRCAATRWRGASAERIVQAIFAAMDEFTGGLQTDDATVVVLRLA